MEKIDNIAVMVSGKGSNLKVMLDAIAAGCCPVRIQVVIANRVDAQGLQVARSAGVPQVLFLDPKSYVDRVDFDMACASVIEKLHCQWVVLAGYMRILSADFVQRFAGRIINIHPALLPAFPGAHGVEDALHHGVKVSGCTVHLVDDKLDDGPILGQAAVEVYDDDDSESLRARIQQQEHQLYPQVLAKLVREGFDLEGRRVIWRGEE